MPIQVSLRALRKVIYKKCLHTDDTEISFRADQVKLEPCPNWSPSEGGLILIFRRASPSLSYRSPTGVTHFRTISIETQFQFETRLGRQRKQRVFSGYLIT